ncbi:GH3 auxin-responsive promoter family protein [Telluribacter sp. SYSU D00476]|uniref:GH3 family domain-containing protein n=1 Tax=Telluribacter sp. SYSU D00476 TaxID=2811430 RepID=UPI001FF118AF|nr:GH3 auxin-responsive promoter family protein [Telluribacter sp. SYSU D00476]
MPIIGNIIKKAIELTDTLSEEVSPHDAQLNVLKSLLKKAKNTAFGQHYNFEEILASENIQQEFARRIPPHDYDKMAREWWHRTLEGEEDVTWPGKPSYFALSSGTTSNSKHIPVTDDLLAALRSTAIQQILSLSEFDLPPHFFEKQIMMLGSSTHLKEKDGHLEGEISGISASTIPFWFDIYYKPGKEIAGIDDWDARIQRIAEKARDWDIGSLSGIPAWIELMLKRVIEYHGVNTIHDIWPNLMVYTSGGVALDPYKKSLEKLLAHPLIYIDTYLASEGFLAYQSRPDTKSMKLSLNNGIYFEFVPFEEKNMQEDGTVRPDAEVHTIDEVEENRNYVLLISTVTGAWRYMIGDTVQFTDKSRSEIEITGRTKFFLNVVGSQLSVHQMEKAILHLNEKYNVDVKEFIVAAVKREDGEYIHHWYMGCDSCADNDQITAALDANLQENNKNYKVARGKALKGVKVTMIPSDIFYDWSEATKKKGGQVKIPRVMKEEQFLEWEEFVKSKLQTS